MHHPQHHRQHPTTIYQQQHVRQASQATTAPSIDDQTEQKDRLLDDLPITTYCNDLSPPVGHH